MSKNSQVFISIYQPQQNTPLQQWCFEDEPIIRIGRSPDNHIVLTDPLVSRHHLELRQINSSQNGSSWQLINRGTNGTFLDGILVSQSSVTDGALIQLARGGPLLKFQIFPPLSTTTGEQQKGSLPTSSISNSKLAHHSPLATPSSHCTHSGNEANNLFCIRCGQPISVQRQIRHYQVLRILGQGGMGTTYLAWEPTGTISGSPQLLVLKEMNADMAKIAKAQELFEREARTLKMLHHPGIPKYYDFFMEGSKKYLAMELVHGQDLERRIMTTGPVTFSQAIAWMLQTCDVLDYLHSQAPPLIHRDIKPANLMVRALDNQIVVLDFGAVKEIGTAPGTRIGAEGYCAPEQERGQPQTQSDLYAVGATLIFLLTGNSPFKFYQLRGRAYQFQLENVINITPQLRAVIERVTQTRPSDRYTTAGELAAALASCQ